VAEVKEVQLPFIVTCAMVSPSGDRIHAVQNFSVMADVMVAIAFVVKMKARSNIAEIETTTSAVVPNKI